jgi:hypothetical protein
MKLTKILLIALAAIFLLSESNNFTFAQEKKMNEKDVPTMVMNSFHKAYPKAEIKGISTETEKGKNYFEIESVEGSKHIDLLISKTGQITEVEETIPVEQLPSRIMKALETKFKGLKIEKAEKVSHGAVTNYELLIENKTGKNEVKMDAAGKILKSEKVGKESDKAD